MATAPRWTILHEEPDWLAIDKPAGLLSTPDRFDRDKPNLHDLLTARYGKVHPIHRLDRETSGVILFARTSEANRQLSRQFEEHTVEKTYLALTRGVPTAATGEIDAPLAECPRRPGLMRIDLRHGQPARTRWRVLEWLGPFTLFEVQPLTGRQHQIRVHLSGMGLPLAVDPEYGGNTALFLSEFKPGYKRATGGGERPLIARLTLHAARLRFRHPSTQEPIEVTAPLPHDFEVALKQIRRWVGSAAPAPK